MDTWEEPTPEQMQSDSLLVIRGIVERYGGTVDVDIRTNTLYIDVPEGKEHEVALELDKALPGQCT